MHRTSMTFRPGDSRPPCHSLQERLRFEDGGVWKAPEQLRSKNLPRLEQSSVCPEPPTQRLLAKQIQHWHGVTCSVPGMKALTAVIQWPRSFTLSEFLLWTLRCSCLILSPATNTAPNLGATVFLFFFFSLRVKPASLAGLMNGRLCLPKTVRV